MYILNDKWCKRFLNLAYEIASWSKDTSTQVGCVIMNEDGMPLSFGYNGMPRGIEDDVEARHERPEKYFWFEHAERNAIYQCQTSLKGATAYVTHAPCSDCARAFIQSGIKAIVIDRKNDYNSVFGKRLGDSGRAAFEMIVESNTKLLIIDMEE